MAFVVDFSKVEESKSFEIPEGKYLAKVESVNVSDKEGDSGFYFLIWRLKITTAPAKNLHINHITSLKPSALFNLRDTLTALGVNVPKGKVKLNASLFSKFKGRELGIEVYEREKNGKTYPNVKNVFPKAEYSTSSVDEDDDFDDDDELSF